MTDKEWEGMGVMVLDATFNNISVISLSSVLLVEEPGVPGVWTNNITGDKHWLHM